MKRIATIIVLVLSLIGFILSYIFPNEIAWSISGVIFYAFIYVLFHELGHVIGVLLAKGKVTEYQVSIFKIRDRKFTILDEWTLAMHVKFISEKKRLIFLMGPLFSLVFLMYPLLEFFFFPSFHSVFYLITYGILLLINLIPGKNSDMMRIIKG